MASSLGFQKGHEKRARDGMHRSANREDRQEYNERLRRTQDVQIALGRLVLPRVRSSGAKPGHHPIAEYVSRMGYKDANQQFGEAVTSDALMLQYLTPNMMANLFDCFMDGNGSRRNTKLTPRGRKEAFRQKKKEIQADFYDLQAGQDPRTLELVAPLRNRIFDDTAGTGLIELAVSKETHPADEIIEQDIAIINGIFARRLPGAPEIGFEDVAFRLPVFRVNEKSRNEDTVISRPLLPMAPTVFQPLGIHEIPSN